MEPGEEISKARLNRQLLLGTGLSWLIYDVVYYGTALNLPSILATVMGEPADDAAEAMHDMVVSSMAIPGVICALRMMGGMGGPKILQAWGFVAIGVLCALLSILTLAAPVGNGEDGDAEVLSHEYAAFLLCCLLIFALNWGCSVSTYVLPMVVFPRHVRASYHGLSAGMGKFGGLLSGIFYPVLRERGMGWTFALYAALCALGALVTHLYVQPEGRDTFRLGTEEHGRSTRESQRGSLEMTGRKDRRRTSDLVPT